MKTQCMIVGGGPAGMMLGVLLARAGVSVLVLEKHADFLRDFCGDTFHPSIMEILHELGWLNDFLKLPHQKAHEVAACKSAAPPRVSDKADSIYSGGDSVAVLKPNIGLEAKDQATISGTLDLISALFFAVTCSNLSGGSSPRTHSMS